MGAATLIDLLKRHLKAHGITYAKVAERLGLSEASVKRMFSRHDFTLQRLEDVCRVADLDFAALVRALYDEQASAAHLTVEQEQEQLVGAIESAPQILGLDPGAEIALEGSIGQPGQGPPDQRPDAVLGH